MKVSNLSVGRTKLHTAMKTLLIKWEETKESWDDSVSRRFEEEYIAELQPTLIKVVQGIDHLIQVLGKAEDDCG